LFAFQLAELTAAYTIGGVQMVFVGELKELINLDLLFLEIEAL
jgi:hypothetical protein